MAVAVPPETRQSVANIASTNTVCVVMPSILQATLHLSVNAGGSAGVTQEESNTEEEEPVSDSKRQAKPPINYQP